MCIYISHENNEIIKVSFKLLEMSVLFMSRHFFWINRKIVHTKQSTLKFTVAPDLHSTQPQMWHSTHLDARGFIWCHKASKKAVLFISTSTDFVSAWKDTFKCYQNWKDSNCVTPVSLMGLPVWGKTTTRNSISNSRMLILLNTTPKGSCLGWLRLRILFPGPESGSAVYDIRSHMSGHL